MITDKTDKINKIIIKKTNDILIKFYNLANIVLIIFYLFPGSIFGYFLYNNSSIQPQITRDFFISSNHFYVFTIFSIIGVIAYRNIYKKNLFIYLFSLSIILEFFHLIIPNRGFEFKDLLGNISGVVLVFIFYKFKEKY